MQLVRDTLAKTEIDRGDKKAAFWVLVRGRHNKDGMLHESGVWVPDCHPARDIAPEIVDPMLTALISWHAEPSVHSLLLGSASSRRRHSHRRASRSFFSLTPFAMIPSSVSTAKGKRFEVEVYEDIKSDIARFGLNPDRCKVFLNKAYPSRDRGASITVDVSIEAYAEGQTEPSLIWIWECKDLSRPVSVEDFEKLHSILEQIGPDNTKGTLVARGTFTKGGRKYAESKKIGYARYYQRIAIANPFGGWPQEWIDTLQRDFELILSDEDARYDQNIRIVGRRFFGRHTIGSYDYSGALGEFVYFELACHRAFQLANRMLEEERKTTPAWVFTLRRIKSRLHSLGRRLPRIGRRRQPSGHTGPREVKVRKIF